MNASPVDRFRAANSVASTKGRDRSRNGLLQQRIETVLRFAILGVPGFLIVVFCWLTSIIGLSYGEPMVMSPLLFMPIALVGALTVLVGTQQYSRPGYMCVFLSVPLIATLWALVSPLLARGPRDLLQIHPKLMGMLLFVIPAVVIFLLVNRYYRAKGAGAIQWHER
jgi:hypothetical protein